MKTIDDTVQLDILTGYEVGRMWNVTRVGRQLPGIKVA